MSKAKLAAARELINEKNYVVARAVLMTLPADDTARRWLERLNEIAPLPKTPVPTMRRRKSRLPLILLVISVAVLAGLLWTVRTNSLESAEQGRLYARLIGYCIDIVVQANVRGSAEDLSSGCNTFVGDAMRIYADEVRACNQQSPELDNPFHTCLYREGIVPINLGILPP